jgi:ABC-type Na+ efflux pump permease subunit
MSFNAMHVRAVVRKELRDYRRKRSIVVTMGILPLLFLVQPVISVFLATPGTTASQSGLVLPILYLLLIPTIMPSTLAAYTVVGEREQGTLEPLLTTPLRQQEFILGKAASVMIPTLLLSYTVFGLFLVAVWLGANAAVASAVFHDSPVILALFLLSPLMATWGIGVGMAMSVRATEVRVAQQLGMLASLPPVGVIILLAAGIVSPTLSVALEFAAGLLVIDALLLRFVSGMFDRERLVTGAKAV